MSCARVTSVFKDIIWLRKLLHCEWLREGQFIAGVILKLHFSANKRTHVRNFSHKWVIVWKVKKMYTQIKNSKESSFAPLNILMATSRLSLLSSIPVAMPLATLPNAPLPITLTKTRFSLGISQFFSDVFGSTGGITLYSWGARSNDSFGGVTLPESG